MPGPPVPPGRRRDACRDMSASLSCPEHVEGCKGKGTALDQCHIPLSPRERGRVEGAAVDPRHTILSQGGLASLVHGLSGGAWQAGRASGHRHASGRESARAASRRQGGRPGSAARQPTSEAPSPDQPVNYAERRPGRQCGFVKGPAAPPESARAAASRIRAKSGKCRGSGLARDCRGQGRSHRAH